MKEYLQHIIDVLAAYDFPTVLEAIRQLEWSEVAKSFYTWLIVLPLLTFLLWTKKFKALLCLISCVLFVVLVQRTIAPVGQTLALHDLFVFFGGAVALIGFNLYLIFIRE